jgi:hypothetical protein
MNTDVRKEFNLFTSSLPEVSYRNMREASSSVYNGDPDVQSANTLIFAAEIVLRGKLRR